jgi:group I intron endonuclease
MTIYTIYKLTNKVNNKSYIGFTKRWPQRIKEHSWACTNMLIHKAIRKYGMDSFESSILYQGEDKDFTLSIMEPHYIKMYNTLIEGYNQTSGGEGTSVQKSIEHKRKIGLAHIGMKRSKQTCANISKAKIGKKNVY